MWICATSYTMYLQTAKETHAVLLLCWRGTHSRHAITCGCRWFCGGYSLYRREVLVTEEGIPLPFGTNTPSLVTASSAGSG